jgi:hypothetical protein
MIVVGISACDDAATEKLLAAAFMTTIMMKVTL